MVIDASFVKRHIKPKADSTLLNMKKADLVEYIRTLEHNHNVAVSFNEQQARNVEDMMKNGMTFAKDTDVPGRWISVEDGLPDLIPCGAGTAYSEAVNILTSRRKVLTAIWDGNNFIADAEFWEAEGEEITHWTPVLLPLPEPPKEDLDAKKGDADE